MGLRFTVFIYDLVEVREGPRLRRATVFPNRRPVADTVQIPIFVISNRAHRIAVVICKRPALETTTAGGLCAGADRRQAIATIVVIHFAVGRIVRLILDQFIVRPVIKRRRSRVAVLMFKTNDQSSRAQLFRRKTLPTMIDDPAQIIKPFLLIAAAVLADVRQPRTVLLY